MNLTVIESPFKTLPAGTKVALINFAQTNDICIHAPEDFAELGILQAATVQFNTNIGRGGRATTRIHINGFLNRKRGTLVVE